VNNNTFIIAQEAFKYIVFTLALSVVLALLDWEFFSLLSLLATALLIYIFRNPERVVIHFQNKNIVSVCDGEVISIENVDGCEFFDSLAIKVEIKNSLIDTSFLRAPFDATISQLNSTRGAQLSSSNRLSTTLNENSLIKYTSENDFIVVQHMSEKSFDPIHMYIENGQNVKASQRVGVMLRGVTTIYLPLSSRISLHVGDKLKASESLLGYFSDADE